MTVLFDCTSAEVIIIDRKHCACTSIMRDVMLSCGVCKRTQRMCPSCKCVYNYAKTMSMWSLSSVMTVYLMTD